MLELFKIIKANLDWNIVTELNNLKAHQKSKKIKMIDIKNSSTDYLQRSTGTLNNISMIFGMISIYKFQRLLFILF